MPSAKQHGQRVIAGQRFLADPNTQSYCEQLVTEYFYACLHTIEAVFASLHRELHSQPHYYRHADRNAYFRSISLDLSNPLCRVAMDYEALRGLSEQARYLSPAGDCGFTPLSGNRDVLQAQELHDDIRKAVEQTLKDYTQSVPWETTPK